MLTIRSYHVCTHMRLEHYDSEKLKKELREIFEHHLDLSRYAVFFFGSRVAGGGDDRSDIDVGIEGDSAVPFGVLGKIREDVDLLPTLYAIEVVDFARTSPSFQEVAKRHLEYICEPIPARI